VRRDAVGMNEHQKEEHPSDSICVRRSSVSEIQGLVRLVGWRRRP